MTNEKSDKRSAQKSVKWKKWQMKKETKILLKRVTNKKSDKWKKWQTFCSKECQMKKVTNEKSDKNSAENSDK